MSHHHECACTACHACSCAQGKEGEPRGEWKKLALAAGLFSLGFFLPVPLAIKLPFYLAAYFISGIEVWQACYSNVKAGVVHWGISRSGGCNAVLPGGGIVAGICGG